jgi:hypothetical protein
MWGSDSRFDTSSYSFELASGAETIGGMGVRVEASEKAEGTSEGFAVNQSIIDRHSKTETETETEDMMRWDGGRAWPAGQLLEWEAVAMDRIKWRMEDFGRCARKGSPGIKSSEAVFEISRRKDDVS